jgi:hypothetical protein
VADAELAIVAWRLEAGALVFEFPVVSGRAYRVLVSDHLVDGGWSVFSNMPSEPGARNVQVTVPLTPTSPMRFFRVVTP